MPNADAMPVAADDVADLDRADEVHFLNGDGNDASLCDFRCQYAAAQIHLRHNPAAENVLVGIGIARHSDGTQEQFALRALAVAFFVLHKVSLFY